MPNYSLYNVYNNRTIHLGKKTILNNFKETPLSIEPNEYRYENRYMYEITVTFSHYYWSLNQAVSYGIIRILELIYRALHRTQIGFILDYSIEYQENGYPHFHGHILAEQPLEAHIQKQIFGQLCDKFGRSQWYQTENRDHFHETSGMKWSEYIRKDIIENNNSGCIHAYSIERIF